VSDLRALVVDDEPLAREGLRAELAALGGVTVVAECGDALAAHDAIRRERPDVLFVDVEMPEIDGFALLERLTPEDTPPAVVFVTAYDAHALRAFEAHALDYVLKPLDRARLRLAVERAAQRVREAEALRATLPQPAGLLVRDRNRTTLVPLDDVEWIEAETYYVRLHGTTDGGRGRLLRERMHVLEARLDGRFFRTHRSAIVRLDRVRVVHSLSKYEHSVELASGARAPLSRERRARLETLLAERSAAR